MRKKILLGTAALALILCSNAQERVVKVDFETNSFKNTPSIPFDQPFMLEGEVYRDVEYVEVLVFNENSSKELYSYSWNREDKNLSETFSLVIPGVLKSNSKYDFQVITYKLMSAAQKESLMKNMNKLVSFYLYNNFQFDGKSVSVNNPKQVYKGLKDLIDEALQYQESKNNIGYGAPSALVLDELEKQSEFRFKTFLRRTGTRERDTLAAELIGRKVEHLTNLILVELTPYFNSALVQHHRSVTIKSVPTDKEPFSLPVNAGMYAWNKNVRIDNASVHNTNFTPGLGFSIPFANKSTLMARSKLFDSFGYSMGVLVSPVRDAGGTEFVTPGINLPVYAGLGLRLFKVVRFNAGVLVLGEKGLQDFNGLTVIPTAGLALELNLWMGIKR
ncbi:MAG: hypothetical protein JXR52_12635 [Bacteroidales bacterium]|nr:hypothetical protein [Bacteroidales bacterium]MBN2699665.1 hypothetical protein [Bacteroidales bacterium]